MSKRDYTLDIARSLCVIWIVCFWHVGDYLDYSRASLESEIGSIITMGVLACFTFMSGFLLKKYSFESLNDTFAFYKKRLSRFYILLVVSASSLYIAGLVVGQYFYSSLQFLSIIFGFGVFIDTPPSTLWYFSMIMLFYIITPLIQYKKSLNRQCISFIAFLSIFATLKYFSSFAVDSRLLLYFPIYFIGLVFRDSWMAYVKSKKLLSVFFPFLLLFLFRDIIPTLYDFTGSILIGSLIITISELVSKVCQSWFFVKVSYSSMCAYLFHRHFYLLFVLLYNIGNTGSLRSATIPVYIAIICMLIIFMASYIIQKIFDMLNSNFLKHKI